MTGQSQFPRETLPRIAGVLKAGPNVTEVLVGGSIARGEDDAVSDLDLWVRSPSWTPVDAPGLFVAVQSLTVGGLPFFHGVDRTGVIIDVMVGETPWDNYLPIKEVAPESARVEPASLEPFDLYTEFWINSYKSRKPLFRGLSGMCLFGLHFERMLIFRAWVKEDTGEDPGPGAFSIHGLGALVVPHLTASRWNLLGMSATNEREIVGAIDAYRGEMRRLMPRTSALMDLTLHDLVYREARSRILA